MKKICKECPACPCPKEEKIVNRRLKVGGKPKLLMEEGKRYSCKLCGQPTFDGMKLANYLYFQTIKEFEKHMKKKHPKEYKEMKG